VEAEIVHYCGYKGNFRATVAVGPGKKERRLEHGAAIIATGGMESRPFEYLYGQHPKVMTQLQLENLLHMNPEAVAGWQQVVMIQCVGSRTADNPTCSRVCCPTALKHALELKQLSPEIDILLLYRDLRTYGLLEDYVLAARDQGVLFERYDLDRVPQVQSVEGRLEVSFVDPILQRPFLYQPDAVILSTGAVPADIQDLATMLPVQRDASGFLVEAHPKLRPVDGVAEGIYLCGLAHSPKLLNETIAQALAAAGRAGAFLANAAQIESPIVSHVDPERCVGCLACVRSCPYGIPHMNEEHRSEIQEALCLGCGVCAAACPAQAIDLAHYEDGQLMAEIEAC
jgi:heterodisulfide reductase subunit A-like polyferredoxin